MPRTRGNRSVPSTDHRYRRTKLAAGLLAVGLLSLWNRIVQLRGGRFDRNDSAVDDPVLTEHERSWRSYLRGFHAHHGAAGSLDRDPTDGRLVEGLLLWVESSFLRGYTIGNDVYLCPRTPRAVRVHQAGHTPSFGDVFEPIAGEYREDGGLPDEPLRTFDVMLPGDVPHTFLRLTDRRGLGGAYRAWDHEGRIRRVRE